MSAMESYPTIELFRTDQYYIFVKGEYGLWWNRITGDFQVKTGWDLASANDPDCLGLLYGIVGKIELQSVIDSRLVLIKECAPVGDLPGGKTVYKVRSVAFLPLGAAADGAGLGLAPCRKHQDSGAGGPGTGIFDSHQKAALAKTWGTIKSATNSIKTTTQQAAALATSQVKSSKKKDSKDRERFERRFLEELQRIFTETDSFYYCLSGDLTNSLQRRSDLSRNANNERNALWETVDDRFFWNKHMLADIISLNSRLADPWILPIIQGFVQIEHCKVEVGYEAVNPRCETFTLILISRRSRFRAGTRYKRRGVDENGKCANYVETEQIVNYHHHQVSFVQVRGSVPVFWSQPGYKYRPPPRIDKGEQETQVAFAKHFEEEQSLYGPVCIVNLVEQMGKEKVIWDAYTDHIVSYNNPSITYATFDFHEYCRGMHFENVSVLISHLIDVIKDMGYCWEDREGQICRQRGVFRVNCIDCLDRTNVVQTAIGKAVMEIQFSKLGLIPPDGIMPANIRNTFQLLWANNGDIISKQYAGTNALKGDYTRTGERKFTGLMKDGMNSANRYYLSRFKDAYRQATIDMMLGNPVSADLLVQDKGADEEDSAATAEHVKLVIEDCKKMLISDVDIVLGAWGLIDADPVSGDPNETEMDAILILTKDSYYVAKYDDELDKVTKYQRVLLEDLTHIEFGTPDGPAVSLFKQSPRTAHHCVRLRYMVAGRAGYHHVFRSTGLRFFNNLAVAIKTDEEMIESLKAICEALQVALEIAGLPPVPFSQGRLDRRKSAALLAEGSTGHRLTGSGSYLDITALPHMTRNVSETQLQALRVAGSKALTNVTQQFNKLNKLSHSFNTRKTRQDAYSIATNESDRTQFAVGPAADQVSCNSSKHSSGEEDDNVSLYVTEQSSFAPESGTDSIHLFVPNVGIVMSKKVGDPSVFSALEKDRQVRPSVPFIANVSLSRVVQNVSVHDQGLSRSRSDLNLALPQTGRSALSVSQASSMSTSPRKSSVTTPEITVESAAFRRGPAGQEQSSNSAAKIADEVSPNVKSAGQDLASATKLTPPNTLHLTRKLSHSSGEVDQQQAALQAQKDAKNTTGENKPGGSIPRDAAQNFLNSQRSSSVKDLSLNITSSQSENAIRSIRTGFTNAITSPVAVTRDLVLSPFSKLAKGMQHLGANLDPRKLKSSGGAVSRHVLEQSVEEHRKLQQKWKSCRSRLIAL
ncbi:phosphatidylinositide phosphatase SAC2 [Bacillus rossius redtenbacheri]|uniref:phosphatidylinositide phosphatase SAC2 n=1 Tax=Bacillus rossius redtenbacheri TaxID=93214 RepID=UPI002FDD868C